MGISKASKTFAKQNSIQQACKNDLLALWNYAYTYRFTDSACKKKKFAQMFKWWQDL